MANSNFNIGDVESQINTLSEQIGTLIKSEDKTVTTSANGNASLEINLNDAKILAITAVENGSAITFAYCGAGNNPLWYVHAMSDNSSQSVIANTTIKVRYWYI